MITQVDNYRSWEISFDTEKETFTAYSSSHDIDGTKQSYSAIKKFIDDFIKDNQSFRPFYISEMPNTYKSKLKKLKVIGICKDGRFITEDGNGVKVQLSTYDEKSYMLHQISNDAIIAEYNRLLAIAKEANKQAEEYLTANLQVKPIEDIRKEIN